MSEYEIIKSEYNTLNEDKNYETYYFKTSADLVVGLGRMKSTAYIVGDVVYTDNNISVALKCITAGTTSDSELDISSNAIGDTVTDGSVTWQVCNRTSDVTSVNGKTGDVVVDLPVGFMYFSVEPTVPAGRLPAFGALYNRALYADLWAYAQDRGLVISESEWQAQASANDGNCAYYSSGDGSTTFRVPKLPNTIASDVPSEVPVVGNGMAVGLTNGIGNFGLVVGAAVNNGKFFVGNDGGSYGQPIGTFTGTYVQPTVQDYRGGLTTDPAKSGIVAQTSATKITGQWLIVAFGVAHNIGEADVADVMQAVETAQTSVQAVDNKITGISDYIIESYRNGTEWYEVYKSGKVRQGGRFTAGNNKQITFLKTMADTNYTITSSLLNGSNVMGWRYSNLLTTGFTAVRVSDTNAGGMWTAEGQGA